MPSDRYAGRRVLVTGGAGFIGSHLVEELVRCGADVVVVDNLASGHLNNLAHVRERVGLHQLDLAGADLRPLLAEHRFDFLFHLAGMALVSSSVENPRKDLERNLLATFNLLEAMRDVSRTTRLVNISSAAVYGDASEPPWDETAPTAPVSPYGVSKLAAERYAAVFAQLYDMRSATVRPFPAFGPRLRKQVVYDLMRRLSENSAELAIYGTGLEARDLTYVGDLVDALLLVGAKAPLRGEIYNVGTGETVTIRHVAEVLCEELGVSPRLVFEGKPRPGDLKVFAGDIGRVADLGYRTRVGLREGLARTVAWFREDADPERERGGPVAERV